jgi:hypothetical protein
LLPSWMGVAIARLARMVIAAIYFIVSICDGVCCTVTVIAVETLVFTKRQACVVFACGRLHVVL